MLNFLFLFLFLLFPLTVLRLNTITSRLMHVSILSILFWGIIIFNYIGLGILMFDLDKFRSSDITNKSLLFGAFLATLWTLIILIIQLNKSSPPIIKRINRFEKTRKPVIFFFDILFSICIVVLISYINKIGFQNIALFSILSTINPDTTLLRSEMTNNFSDYHWYYLFTNRLMLFCSYFYFSIYLLETNKRHFFKFFLSVILTSFSLTMTTEKGPLAYFVLSLFFCFIITRKSKITFKGIFKISLPILLILTVFYSQFMNVRKVGTAIGSVFSRTLTGQIQPSYHYLEFFPEIEPFLLGKSMTNPGGIFPFTTYNIPQEVMAWYNTNEHLSGIVGSMPTIFWGEAYANFGVLGIIIAPIIIFYFIRLVEKFFSRLQINSITVAAYIWIVMYFLNLSITGYSNFIFDIYGIAFLMAFITALFIQYKGKIYFKKT